MKRLGIIFICLLFSACNSAVPTLRPETRDVVFDKPAVLPPGAVRYCWEEPMVQLEQNGPGLDSDERYYRPAYVAVREVKQGRWRPCRNVPSEVKGETKNEW